MKIVLFLIGSLLFGAGLYTTNLGFTRFSELEPTQFGLFIGLAFVAMSAGLTFIFLPFKRKAKPVETVSVTEGDKELFMETLEEPQELLVNETPEETNDLTKILTVEDLKETKTETQAETIALKRFEEVPVEEPLSQAEADLEEETTETLKNFYTDQDKSVLEDETSTESMEARLIGIEAWSIQRVLKKLPEDAQVSYHMVTKHGLSLAEITYQNKAIGYLSKVDYIKMEDKLSRLKRIEVATLVQESRAVDSVILRFIFNL